MAKQRLTLYDKYGNVIEYDISAASITIDAEGKQLDVKLTELADAIAARIRSVTFNGSEKTPDQQGKISISQEQPNWNESNTQHPSFIQGKPQLADVATSGDYNDLKNLPTIPEGGDTAECDTAMSDTSEAPVQNKVIKAYVDAVSQRIDTLIGSGNVQGAIDTFNEVVAFLDGIDTDDPTLANQLLALNNAITALQTTLSQKANDNAVVKSISVNGGTAQTPDGNGNVNIQVQGGGLSKEDISVETQGDGTVDINVADDTYTINLNHTHENMAKLVLCEESDLPSTLDPATIYAQVDDVDTPTEIQSLWIAGLEFVGGGGGVPDDEPRLTSPRSGVTIDFAGQSTATLLVKGKNLAAALSIAVTGDFSVSLNGSTVSSIAASDANNGVTLTLTKGSAFSGGTIAISSTEVETRTCSVEDSEESALMLDGIKLTGTQWLQTDFVPTAATDIEMKLKFTANAKTETTDESAINFLTCYTLQGTNKQYTHAASTKTEVDYSQYIFAPVISASSPTKVYVPKTDFVLDKSTYRHLHGGSLTFIAGEGGTSYSGTTPAVVTQVNPLTIGFYHTTGGVDQIFNKYDLTIYEFTVKENNVTLRHYVPAMVYGVPGLYDTITGHFASSKTSTPVEVVTNA